MMELIHVMLKQILPSGGDKKHYPIAFNALPQINVFTDVTTHTKK